jgi:ribosome recycling factor
VDGQILRVNVPPLTEERRRDLVKQLKRQLEEQRVAIRNIRREAVEQLRANQKDRQISEDEERRGQTEVQKLTDKYIKALDDVAEAREHDIMMP